MQFNQEKKPRMREDTRQCVDRFRTCHIGRSVGVGPGVNAAGAIRRNPLELDVRGYAREGAAAGGFGGFRWDELCQIGPWRGSRRVYTVSVET